MSNKTKALKAEFAWVEQLAKGSKLPRGKAFRQDLTPQPVAKAKPTKSAKPQAAKVEQAAPAKAAPEVKLTEAQQAAMTALQSVADYTTAKALGVRKATLDALLKKELVESREQDGEAQYKAK